MLDINIYDENIENLKLDLNKGNIKGYYLDFNKDGYMITIYLEKNNLVQLKQLIENKLKDD